MRQLFLAIAAIGLAGAASSETLTIAENTYSPLMDTKNGQIMSCGIHYSTFLTRYDGTPLGVQGSFSLMSYGSTDLIVASKATAVTANEEGLSRLRVHNLALRGQNGGVPGHASGVRRRWLLSNAIRRVYE